MREVEQGCRESEGGSESEAITPLRGVVVEQVAGDCDQRDKDEEDAFWAEDGIAEVPAPPHE